MTRRILVAHASRHGATAEIAERIGETLRRASLPVDIAPVEEVADLTPYHAVVLGSAVYVGRWRKEAVGFVRRNLDALAERSVWLFSSGPTGEGDPLELTSGWHYPKALEHEIERLEPIDVAVFHGALDPDKLTRVERWVIRRVGAPTGDFRDFETIDDWAEGIVRALEPALAARG